MHIDELAHLPAAPASTPAAEWRVKGEVDPHGTRYDGERAQLALGMLTDDDLANGIFMNYDHEPSIEDTLNRKEGVYRRIVWMTAGKERIRWLSRALVKAQEEAAALRQTMERGTLIDLPTISNYIPPAGYALVPIKQDGKAGLTDTMMRAFYEAWEDNSRRGMFERLSAGYNAMIAVAPTLPEVAASEAPKPPIAIEALKEVIQTDPEYAWVWQSTLAMCIKDSLGCSNVQGNKAAASIMELVFDVDVRKLKEWNHDPEPKIDSRIPIDPENLKLVLRTIGSLENAKIYSDRDRGYNKALDHVLEKIAELFTTVFDTPITSAMFKDEDMSILRFNNAEVKPLAIFKNDGTIEIPDTSKLDEAARSLIEIASRMWKRECVLRDASIAKADDTTISIPCDLVTIDDTGVCVIHTTDLRKLLGISPVDEDEWEYETVERGRKSSAEIYPPDGEGWEPDYSRGRPGEAWDRFDNHEETYWKRRKPKA